MLYILLTSLLTVRASHCGTEEFTVVNPLSKCPHFAVGLVVCSV